MVLESCHDFHCNPAMNKMTTRFYANKDHHRPKAACAPQRGLGEALTLHMTFQAHPEADLQPSAWV